MRQSSVSRSSAAHQPSASRAMARVPQRSSTVRCAGTSSSLINITASLQQQALHEAQVIGFI